MQSWSIWYNFLIYKPAAEDANSNFIFLVDLERENSLVMIEDFTPNPPEYRHYAFHN